MIWTHEGHKVPKCPSIGTHNAGSASSTSISARPADKMSCCASTPCLLTENCLLNRCRRVSNQARVSKILRQINLGARRCRLS